MRTTVPSRACYCNRLKHKDFSTPQIPVFLDYYEQFVRSDKIESIRTNHEGKELLESESRTKLKTKMSDSTLNPSFFVH